MQIDATTPDGTIVYPFLATARDSQGTVGGINVFDGDILNVQRFHDGVQVTWALIRGEVALSGGSAWFDHGFRVTQCGNDDG